MSIELLTYENNTGDLTARRIIRDGIAGNYEVVLEMIRLIRASIKDYRVKNIAHEILDTRGLSSLSSEERQLQAIFNEVARTVKYEMDAGGAVESVKSAYRTLSDHFGDCDDLTIACCSLAAAIGFEKVAVALAKYSPSDTTFSHVYAVIYSRKGERFVLDPSLPNAQFNQEVKPFEVKEIFVFETVNGIDGIAGIWSNTRSLSKKIAGAALKAIPEMAEYLPLSFVPTAAFSTGAQLLNATGQRTKSINETGTEINRKLDAIINQLVTGQLAVEIAQNEGAKLAAQLSMVDTSENTTAFKTVKESVFSKLSFIKNYKEIAAANNLPIVHLNANAMFLLGAGGAAYGAFKLYKYLTKGRE